MKRTAPSLISKLLLAICAPLFLLLAVEVGLRLFGMGEDLRFWIEDESSGRFRTNPAFASVFMPSTFGLQPQAQWIDREKPADVIRIFVFGESAVQGVPAFEFSLVEQLRAQLRARHPQKRIEVCNLGITAINTHVMLQALLDSLEFKPDAVVIYAGNNEVVGPFSPGSSYGSVMLPRSMIRMSVMLRRSYVGQALGRIVGTFGRRRSWGGMAMFAEKAVAAGDPRLAKVYQNFHDNMAECVQAAREAGARVFVGTVVANLKDCAPFMSVHRTGMTSAEMKSWTLHHEAGVFFWRMGKWLSAEKELSEAVRIDPEYAESHYVLGCVLKELGRVGRSREAFVDALRNDAIRFRPVPEINRELRAVSSKWLPGVRLIDLARELGSEGDGSVGLSGREILLEHVHFNFNGNYLVGRRIAGEIEKEFSWEGAAVRPWLSREESERALGWNTLAELRIFRGMEQQGALPPFTGQLTYGEDRRMARCAILELSEALGEAGSSMPSFAKLYALVNGLETAVEADRENPCLNQLLREIYVASQNFEGILELISEYRRFQPKTMAAVCDHAWALHVCGRSGEAVAMLEAAVVSESSTALLRMKLAEILIDQKRYEAARIVLQAAAAAFPADVAVRLAYVEHLDRMGLSDQALEEGRRVLERFRGSHRALAMFCDLLVRTGDRDAMLELRVRYAADQPENEANSLELAHYYASVGDVIRAAQNYQRAADSKEGDVTTLLLAAQFQERAGNWREVLVNLYAAKRLALRQRKSEAIAPIDDLIAERIGRSVDP